MRRNLNRRTEVALPIFDEKIKNDLQLFIDMQLNDNVKARIINKTQNNLFVKSKISSESLRSQSRIYEYLKQSN
jgi:polyphosphate kinase